MSQPQDNSVQRDAWNGVQGTTWSQFQDALDGMMQPVTAKLVAATDFKPGDTVLDIGCGCGPTTIAAARAVGSKGHATGVDISRLLLESARDKSADLGLPITWIEADASTYKFTHSFDKILSRFGVMFFADPVEAFVNIKSALKPNGKMTFVCWRSLADNRWIADVMAEAAKIVPVPPPPKTYVAGPFAFGDRGFLEGLLRKSGFKAIEIEGIEAQLRIPGQTVDERVAFYMRAGPTSGLLRDATEEQRAKLQAVFRRWAETHFGPGHETQGSAYWLVRAS